MRQEHAAGPHSGRVHLAHPFDVAWDWLETTGEVVIQTAADTQFTARAAVGQRREHRGERVIRFFQDHREYARCYPCCWGYYTNCNRTRIGMYCSALDGAIDEGL